MFDKVLNTPLLVHLEYTNVALNSDIFSVNLGHIAKKASYQSNISNIIIKCNSQNYWHLHTKLKRCHSQKKIEWNLDNFLAKILTILNRKEFEMNFSMATRTLEVNFIFSVFFILIFCLGLGSFPNYFPENLWYKETKSKLSVRWKGGSTFSLMARSRVNLD